MPPLDAEQLLREHLHRNPDLQRAALHDAEYAADVHRLRTVLTRLDGILVGEDMPEEARRRVESRLVADLLGTDEAHDRIRERTRMVTQVIATGVVCIPVPITW
ncbi:hypothetical protein [Streptomyces microflavus]|uniref:hypothetical protein n=1 Tax=Streptomyces microflavus TaxID=1919 RepID=UPI0038248A05